MTSTGGVRASGPDRPWTVIAAGNGFGVETVRRWVVQAEIDAGERLGVTSEESAEIKASKAKVRRLEEDNAIVKARRPSSPRCLR